MRGRFVFGVAITALVAVAACSSFGGSDPAPEGSDAGDASVTPTPPPPPGVDATSPEDAQADADAAPPNLLVNGDFETYAACSPPLSTTGNATETVTTEVALGSRACLLCASNTGNPSNNAFWDTFVDGPEAGATYTLTAKIHPAADAGALPTGAVTGQLFVVKRATGAGTGYGSTASVTVTAGSGWQDAVSTITVDTAMLDGGDALQFHFVLPQSELGHCFVVDDIRLTKSP